MLREVLGGDSWANQTLNQTAVDPYRVLGLDKTAADDLIKKRYRELIHLAASGYRPGKGNRVSVSTGASCLSADRQGKRMAEMTGNEIELLSEIARFEASVDLEKDFRIGWCWRHVRIWPATLSQLFQMGYLENVFRSNSYTGYRLVKKARNWF